MLERQGGHITKIGNKIKYGIFSEEIEVLLQALEYYCAIDYLLHKASGYKLQLIISLGVLSLQYKGNV